MNKEISAAKHNGLSLPSWRRT